MARWYDRAVEGGWGMIKIKCGNDRCKRTWEKAKKDPDEVILVGLLSVIGFGGALMILFILGAGLYYFTEIALLAIAAGVGFLALVVGVGLLISYLLEPK